MNNNGSPWFRLVEAARKAPQPVRDEAAPHGFATRVAARGLQQRPASGLSLVFDRFSLRALGVATLLMAITVLSCYRNSVASTVADDDSDYQDSVSEILELAS
jgi:hypothetical protein